MKIGINGFGRIGRMFLRAYYENIISNKNSQRGDQKLEIVCINDLGKIENIIHLLKYDSVHGKFPGLLKYGEDYIDLGFGKIDILNIKDSDKLPWDKYDLDLVIECTGSLCKQKKIKDHIINGAKRVLVSTISPEAEATIVYGINENILDDQKIISSASCTSNCIIPILDIIKHSIGIEYGFANSIHAYNNGQSLVDSNNENLYRSRAVASSMIPSTTNASLAIDLIYPDLKDKIQCHAVRVPILNVSLIDFNFCSKKNTSIEDINEIVKTKSSNHLKNILGYTNEPLVSIDFVHDSRSAIIDLMQTRVVKEKLCRIIAWYDNEWGYANRMLDIANYIFQRNKSLKKELSKVNL